MTLTRVSGSLTTPWSLAKDEFDDLFGVGIQEDDSWVWSATFRIYALKLEANRSTGDVEVTVSTILPYTSMAFGSIFLVLLAALTTDSFYAALIAMLVCIPLSCIPLIPGIVHYQWLYQRLPDIFNVEYPRITPVVAVPIGGFLIGTWLISTSNLFQILILLLAAFVTAYALYAVGLVPESLRRQQPMFVFAFFSSFPLLLTIGNFVLVRISADIVSSFQLPYFVWFLGVFTVILLVVYSFLCRNFLTEISDIPNKPISSRKSRAAWFGYFFSLNLLSLLFLAILLIDYGWFDIVTAPIDPVIAGFRTIGVPLPTVVTGTSLAVLALPLIGLLLLWTIHVVREIRRYQQLRAGTTPTDFAQSPYPVRIIETPRPVAYVAPTSLRRSTIVFSDVLCEQLERDELAAVIAHEEYHIRNGDPLWNLLGTLFGFMIGGRNAFVVAHDYPEVEREADHYAAKRQGAETLVRALRSMERLQATTPSPSPQFSGGSRFHDVGWLFSAPYHVLFGSVILTNAHASIDERSVAVLTSAETEEPFA